MALGTRILLKMSGWDTRRGGVGAGKGFRYHHAVVPWFDRVPPPTPPPAAIEFLDF